MPAPRRAILADIHEQSLDPKVAYNKTDKSGKLIKASIEFAEKEQQKQEVETPVFASLKKEEHKDLNVEKKLLIQENETTVELKETQDLDLEKEAAEKVVQHEDLNYSASKKKLKKK
jgi:hypothetical protein